MWCPTSHGRILHAWIPQHGCTELYSVLLIWCRHSHSFRDTFLGPCGRIKYSLSSQVSTNLWRNISEYVTRQFTRLFVYVHTFTDWYWPCGIWRVFAGNSCLQLKVRSVRERRLNDTVCEPLNQNYELNVPRDASLYDAVIMRIKASLTAGKNQTY